MLEAFVTTQKLYGRIIPIIDKPDKNVIELIDSGDLVKVDASEGTIGLTKT